MEFVKVVNTELHYRIIWYIPTKQRHKEKEVSQHLSMLKAMFPSEWQPNMMWLFETPQKSNSDAFASTDLERIKQATQSSVPSEVGSVGLGKQREWKQNQVKDNWC